MNTQRGFIRGLWRWTLGLALALLPMRVLAFDLTPDASRVLSDPAYLPLEAQIFGMTEYSYGITNLNTNNSQGALLSSNNTVAGTINQLLEYGITRDLAFRISGFFQLLAGTNSLASGGSTLTTSDGWQDPSFEAVWRVLDQREHPFSWDLLGSCAPSLISAQSATPDQNGTVARGGSTAALGTALSFKTKSFTAYGEFNAVYQGARNVLNQTTNVTTTYDSNWQYGLYFTTQTRFTDSLSLNAGVSQTFNEAANASFTNANGKLISFSSQPGNITAVVAALNGQVTPDRFVASLIYTHNFVGNGGNSFAAFPKTDTTTTDREADLYSAEVRYVFN